MTKLIDPGVRCPNCETSMEYRIKENEDSTGAGHNAHVWTCEECPIVIFEYYVDQNIEGLKEILK